MEAPNGTELVRAAQGGDPWARDRLVAAYLPLVYNIVGRAMNGHHEVDDVVQETMLRALDGLGGLRSPDSFRSWLVAIAMNAIRAHWHRRQTGDTTGALDDARDLAEPGADFVDLTVARLQLSGQRRETAEATRWLEPEDSALLSLWWLECAGELTRPEVAAALRLSTEHTAVRVQRMKERLETARVVVRALSARPLCPTLRTGLDGWDGRPSPLWRKRIARHARTCPHCAGLWNGLVPAEGLLAGLLLVPPAALLLTHVRDSAGFGLAAAATPVPSASTPVPAAGAPARGADGLTTAADGMAGGVDALSHAADGTRPGADRARHAAAPGPRGARRKEQQRRRGRRRAVAAAGLAVVAVTGGTFVLLTGPEGGDPDATDVTQASAPDAASDLTSPSSTTPGTGTGTASPSSSTSPRPSRTAQPSRTATPSPSAEATTTPPAPRPTALVHRPRPSGATAAGGGSGDTSDSRQVIDLVNTERARAGCGPLTENGLLTQAAQGHSDDMAARNFFDHTDPDGDGPDERVTATGYRWSTYGENIAKGQRTPAQVMDSWMNSPGHRANILNCDFREIGIGIHTAGGPYWTQVFGAR
ncbi:sigma-70 family RNA polymerase sigma factor [Streptomyces sp. NPDC126499]|uniref:sigma-70 family RNA polymerase sigma factor n=1 Tax=Streptomyces sp. NPDC126499 TaxID=3155314 RepID=UPI003323DB91